MQRYKSKYTGPQMDVAFERALPGGEIDRSMSAKLDWEGLVNPEFTVAQAGIGGNHGSVAYAADCWKLVSGTVSAAPGGGLVLNGTIRQTREKAVGFDVVASINVTSGTATAAYDDATKQFDITSSGGTIKRAHLGLIEITDWAKIPHADCGDELAKCQRYYCTSYQNVPAGSQNAYANEIVLTALNTYCFTERNIQFPVKMRTTPSITFYAPGSGNAGKATKSGGDDVTVTQLIAGEDRVSFYSSDLEAGFEYYLHYTASADL